MKSIKWLLVAALAACGGELGEEPALEVADDAAPEEPDVGSSEQGIAIRSDGYGYNVNGQNFRCQWNNGAASDVCIYPGNRDRDICVTGNGMTAGQKTEAEADVDALLPALTSQFSGSGWNFERNCSGFVDVSISYGNITGSQLTTSILGYVKIPQMASTVQGKIPDFIPGTHRLQTGTAAVTVDRAQIVADFAVANQQRVRRHALYGGIYAGATGLGFTPAHTNRVTSIVTTPAAAKLTSVSSQEKCRVDGYDVSNDGLIFGNGTCP